MNWDTIQQVLRILLYTLGGWAFGDVVTEGPAFQNAVAGILAVGAFAWWAIWERSRPAS